MSKFPRIPVQVNDNLKNKLIKNFTDVWKNRHEFQLEFRIYGE